MKIKLIQKDGTEASYEGYKPVETDCFINGANTRDIEFPTCREGMDIIIAAVVSTKEFGDLYVELERPVEVKRGKTPQFYRGCLKIECDVRKAGNMFMETYRRVAEQCIKKEE